LSVTFFIDDMCFLIKVG